MSKFFNAKNIAAAGLLIALNIVFTRILRIGDGYIRISLGFFPICIAGMMFGPLGGGITAVFADIIGMIIFSRGDIYFPLFTVTEFLYGFGFGLMLHKKKLPPITLSLLTGLQFIFLNLIIQTFWLYLYYILIIGQPKGISVLISARLITAAVNLPMQIIGINIVSGVLRRPLSKIRN